MPLEPKTIEPDARSAPTAVDGAHLISREAVRAAAVLAKNIEVALHEVDLSPSQYRVLIFLDESPAAATVLADKLAVTRPSLTALVDGLAARGYVGREPDAEDRRRVTHEISESGRAAIDAADAAIQSRLGGWLSGLLPDEKVGEVNRGLEVWHEALVEARARRLAQ